MRLWKKISAGALDHIYLFTELGNKIRRRIRMLLRERIPFTRGWPL